MLLSSIDGLKPNSRVKVHVRCDVCGNDFHRVFRSLKRHWCVSCTRKDIFERSCRGVAFGKRSGSNHPNWNPDRKSFHRYRTAVNRFTRQNYTKYLHLINPDNLPRTRSGVIGGYQLDHIVTVLEGFQKGIDPSVIADVPNLRMIPWEENIGREKERLRSHIRDLNNKKRNDKSNGRLPSLSM